VIALAVLLDLVWAWLRGRRARAARIAGESGPSAAARR